MANPDRADVYNRITAEIVDAIERGAGAWRMPWHHDGSDLSRPTNIASSRPYRGVNVLALWVAAYVEGRASGVWGTYRQWQAAGTQVRKGERATTVVLWKELKPDEPSEADEDGRKRMAPALSRCSTPAKWTVTRPASPRPPSPPQLAWPTPRTSTSGWA